MNDGGLLPHQEQLRSGKLIFKGQTIRDPALFEEDADDHDYEIDDEEESSASEDEVFFFSFIVGLLLTYYIYILHQMLSMVIFYLKIFIIVQYFRI